DAITRRISHRRDAPLSKSSSSLLPASLQRAASATPYVARIDPGSMTASRLDLDRGSAVNYSGTSTQTTGRASPSRPALSSTRSRRRRRFERRASPANAGYIGGVSPAPGLLFPLYASENECGGSGAGNERFRAQNPSRIFRSTLPKPSGAVCV